MGGINSTTTAPSAEVPTTIAEVIGNATSTTTGQKMPNLKLAIVLVYSIMSLAIFFNLRVIYILVSVLCRRQTTSPSRHAAGGNQHAFVYVLSLSIVDSLVLAHLPFVATDIVVGWVFGTAMCKLFWVIEQMNRILSTFVLVRPIFCVTDPLIGALSFLDGALWRQVFGNLSAFEISSVAYH